MAVTLQTFKDYIGFGETPNVQSALEFQSVPDNVFQNFIDISTDLVRGIIGLTESEDLPISPRVDMAIHFLALYYLQNRSTQEKNYEFNPEEELRFNMKAYYRRLDKAVLHRVISLINKYRKHSRFIPTTEESA